MIKLQKILHIKISNFEKLEISSIIHIHTYAEFLPSLLLQSCGVLENFMITEVDAIFSSLTDPRIQQIIRSLKPENRSNKIGADIITSCKKTRLNMFCKIVHDPIKTLDNISLGFSEETINAYGEIEDLFSNQNLKKDFSTAIKYLDMQRTVFSSNKHSFFKEVETIVTRRNQFAHGLLPIGQLSPLSFSQYFYYIGCLLLLESILHSISQRQFES